ncbi:MAG: TVP38/TMEM64 family protein [Deltaproteobacteria bacterium]
MFNLKNIKIGIKELLIMIGFILVIGIALYYWRDYFVILTDKDKLEGWVNSFGVWRYIVFVLIQVIQVIIFVIPGEVVHIAGGYLFGGIFGSLLSIAGIILGSVVCFFVARTIGQPVVELFMHKKDIDNLKRKINNKRLSVSLFLIFIIPGLPGKDAFTYIAGLTPIKFADFFLVTLTARAPWLIAASCWGSSLEKGNYATVIIISVVAVALFIVGVFKGEECINYIAEKRRNK